MIFTVSKITAGEHLLTPGTGEVVDHAPDSPVHVPPGLQLTFEFQQVVIDVKVLVPRVTEGQLSSLLYRHSMTTKKIYI